MGQGSRRASDVFVECLERMHKESHQFIDLVELFKPITNTDPKALGTVGLHSGDYAMAGFEDADVVIAIGYDLVEHAPTHPGSQRLRDVVLGRFEQAKDDDGFPMQPPRALWEIRQGLGREDILISDVGLHKLWIGRMFPAHEPNTVLSANGLAGMGFALPCAVDFTNPDFVCLAEAFGMPAWRCETVST